MSLGFGDVDDTADDAAGADGVDFAMVGFYSVENARISDQAIPSPVRFEVVGSMVFVG